MKKPKRKKRALFLAGCAILVWSTLSIAQDNPPDLKLPELPEEGLEGKIEIGVHYSIWSINLIKNWFEEDLNKRIGREIRDEVYRHLRDSYPMFNTTYNHELAFDSEGHNLGLGIRFYPKGREGAFSLGFSIEQNRMYAIVQGTVNQNFSDGSYAEVVSEWFIEMKPILTNISFRWDMFPSFPVCPYLTLGVGFGAMNADFGYNYQGVYTWSGGQEQVSDEVQKSYKEWEEEIDFNIPNIFPLLHTGLGLRLQLFPFIGINAEASFWNGFILRVGTALRF